MESKRCESCLHEKVCRKYGIFKDHDYTVFFLQQIPVERQAVQSVKEVNEHWEEFYRFIDDMKREVPCADYISKAEYLHDKHAADVIANDIRTRCTPDASEYFDRHMWGLIKIVPICN